MVRDDPKRKVLLMSAKFTVTNPWRLACTVGGTIAFFLFVGGDAGIAFVVGTFVGGVSYETRRR